MSIENGYAICFNKWLFDKEIKSELNLLLLISSLCAEKGYCWASNEYFANLFQIDEVSISRKIKKLADINHIQISYTKRGCEIIKREIRLTKMLTDDLQKCQPTINKNVKDNITRDNIIKDNINIYTKDKEFSIEEIKSFKLSEEQLLKNKEQKQIQKTQFEELWSLYGKIGNRKQAEKSFLRAIKDISIDRIRFGIENYLQYLKSIQKQDFYPIKHFSTWLNNNGWQDEYQIAKNHNQEQNRISKYNNLLEHD